MPNYDFDELMERVFTYSAAMDMERIDGDKAPLVTAMVRSERTGWLEEGRKILERSIETQTSAGNLNYAEMHTLPNGGHVSTYTPTGTLGGALGYSLMLLNDRSPQDHYMEAAERQLTAVLASPTTRDGAFSDRKEGIELWIDYTYLCVPFLIKFGVVTGREDVLDEGFKQYEHRIDRLWVPEVGLARHVWVEKPNHFAQSMFWSGGNGWFGAAMTEILSMAPDHPRAGRMREVFTTYAHSIREYQDRSGFWHNILDDEDSWLEARGTLEHSFAFARGVELGILDDSFLEPAARGFRVVAGSVRPDGGVPGVALRPGGPTVSFGVSWHGQGFFLQAGEVMERMGLL